MSGHIKKPENIFHTALLRHSAWLIVCNISLDHSQASIREWSKLLISSKFFVPILSVAIRPEVSRENIYIATWDEQFLESVCHLSDTFTN